MKVRMLAFYDSYGSPLIVSLGLAGMIWDTTTVPDGALDTELRAGLIVIAVILVLDLVVRFWKAAKDWHTDPHVRWHDRWHYLVTPHGVIEIISTAALPLGMMVMSDARDAYLFAVAWALKYLQHSTGAALLVRVAARARVAMASVFSLFFVVLLLASTAAYWFERDLQPQVFGSVPKAMWWAIVTLTTTGYGDVVPQTVWGRVLAGWVMVGGIGVFTLWAGIIANAFAEELRRRDFLRTWDVVARASFFKDLSTSALADIVKLIHPRDVRFGTVLFRRGQYGDAMYFIVTGEVAVEIGATPIRLGPGDFVGEMALLYDAPRSATVVATQASSLLVLDIANFREMASHRPELISTIEAEAARRRDANRSAA